MAKPVKTVTYTRKTTTSGPIPPKKRKGKKSGTPVPPSAPKRKKVKTSTPPTPPTPASSHLKWLAWVLGILALLLLLGGAYWAWVQAGNTTDTAPTTGFRLTPKTNMVSTTTGGKVSTNKVTGVDWASSDAPPLNGSLTISTNKSGMVVGSVSGPNNTFIVGREVTVNGVGGVANSPKWPTGYKPTDTVTLNPDPDNTVKVGEVVRKTVTLGKDQDCVYVRPQGWDLLVFVTCPESRYDVAVDSVNMNESRGECPKGKTVRVRNRLGKEIEVGLQFTKLEPK